MEDLIDLLDADVPSGFEGQLLELIIGAQKGSLKELSILARVYGSLPEPLTGQIHLIFLNHLNSSEVPIKPKSDIAGIEERRAFWSLWALAQLAGPLFQSRSRTDPCGEEFTEAWPGVFKWSAYFYTFRVQTLGKDQGATAISRQRRVVRDVLIGSWCALSCSKSAKGAMSRTRGVVDIAARLWIFEADVDGARVIPFCDGIPTMSFLLDLIWSNGDQAALDGLISAAGGDIGRIAQSICSWLKKVIKSSEFVGNPREGFRIFLFFSQLCSTKPEVHEAFLNHGAISICVKLLIRIAFVINEGLRNPEDRPEFVQVTKAAFQFLWSSIEVGTGLPWVLEAIHSGLLAAFVGCSPLYDYLTPDEYIALSRIITNTIPRYLAYCSVVQSVDATFLKLERTAQFLSLRKTRAWEAFIGLATLTSSRMGVVGTLKQVKKETTICTNPRCRKSDVRTKFRKCAKCGWALYCSKGCQTVHWREFGHKKDCREPSKMYHGLQEDGNITPRDLDFIQALNVCEARYNLPYLKRLASTKHPGVPLEDLIIAINYDAVPTTYQVLSPSVLKENTNFFTSRTNPYRPDAEAIFIPYVIGLVPYSGTTGPRTHATEARVWDLDLNLTMMDGTEARVDPTGNKIIDWMSEEAEARAKLYCDF
ncbi:hypothetical protein BDN72DRAFT_897689 [Pluteus cervinus]|uniref:Uncharacterized protein n=1 Tax=Pluteus cervinus TaxID=181527 RepID=A0ACD3AT26_9AGAR|nr:hypothetical protein BDN72DRAFT_897689 [Pluteus cervinus]